MILPREHGAWGMLLLPFASALVVAERRSWLAIPAVVAILAAFFLREPLIVLARQTFVWRDRRKETPAAVRTASASGAALLASGAILAAYLPLAALAALAAPAAILMAASVWAALRNRQRALWLQFVTSLALGSSALLGSLACTGRIMSWAWWLWGLSSLHSAAGVAVVRARLAAMARGPYKPYRRLAVGLVVLTAVMAFAVRPFLSAGLVFSAAVNAREVLVLGRPYPLRRVGLRALATSVVFSAMLVAGLKLARTSGALIQLGFLP